jgi:ABC-type bacteriocin/lantibiotic exporter with double-glycine peptidase domain
MGCAIQKCLILLFCLCSLPLAAEPPGIWLDVPFVKQERNGCGAASIAMVIEYWQRQPGKSPDADSDAHQIQRALYSERARGIYASELGRYLQQHGFHTFTFQGEWNDLKQHLEKGRPLIVALKPHSGDRALHYVVVAGLDWERRLVLVNDPAERKLLGQEWSNFERDWKGAGNWTLLAIPQEGMSPAH